MPHRNFILTVALVCLALVLTGAIRQQGSSAQPAQATAAAAVGARSPERAPTAAAEGPLPLLDRAIAALAPEKLRWLETTLWQQVDCDDFHYQMRGRFLAAPDQRVRLQMQVRVGETSGQWQIVSDGRTLWQLYQVGDKDPAVSQVPLPSAQPGQAAAAVAAVRDGFLQGQGVAGVRPLLQTVRSRLQEPRAATIRWAGRKVYRISGGWPVDSAGVASLPSDLQAAGVPRHCQVYLDAQTLWPYRVEWWTASPSGKLLALLSQTEFRQAILNRELPPERYTREFTFQPPG